MEGNGDEPETIDVWELMKDLEDDENLLNLRQPTGTSFSKQPITSAKFPLDPFTLEPSDVKEVPHWLSSFQTHSSLGRSFASPAEGSSRDLPTYGKPRSKHTSIGSSTSRTSDLLSVKLAGPTQETLAEHLQRSLSFETSPKQEMKRIFGQKDAMNAYYNRGLKLGFDTDASTFSSSQLPWEGESISSPSTPSFSESVSLKKWFQDDARRSKHMREHVALQGSGQATQSKPPPHQVSPPLVGTSKVPGTISKVPGVSHNMRSYVGSDADLGKMHGVSHNMHSYVGSDANVGKVPVVSRNMHSYVGADADVPANQKPSSHRALADQMPHLGLNQTREVSQHSRARRLRHSFTANNRSKEPSEVRNFHANNRSSSLEIEKVVAAPKVRVVLYSTSSKAEDVHAWEDSNAARAILTSIVGAAFEEKSVSQQPEYEQELKRALNTETALVPTVCVRGRYITGLDNIMQMYKKGLLRTLLAESMAEEVKPKVPCICRGGKFLICPVCKGKRKLARKEGDDDVLCRHCSATGLIKCPNCLDL